MLKKPQILVLDNDENILWAFKNFSSKIKMNMVGITTIEEGLKILHEKNFDLIITDIRPNIKSGIKFIQEAKQIIKNIPIIATTSYPDIINAKMLKPYGVEYLLIKPLDLTKLHDAILKCLNLYQPKQSINKPT